VSVLTASERITMNEQQQQQQQQKNGNYEKRKLDTTTMF